MSRTFEQLTAEISKARAKLVDAVTYKNEQAEKLAKAEEIVRSAQELLDDAQMASRRFLGLPL